MHPSWFDVREESSLRRIALLPMSVAATLYGVGAVLHRQAYRRGWKQTAHLSCRVISVGNLSVGGSGKTPMATWIACALRRRGHKVALASRGYGRRGSERVEVVSDGRYVRSSGERAGDEPMLLAAHAPGVPVLVGPDRSVVGLRAVAAFGAQVLILDDGFQHHRLARDLEILAVDAPSGFGNGHVLPRGPLREPLSVLGLADLIGIVDGPLCDQDQERLDRHAPRARRFSATRRPTSMHPLAGGAGGASESPSNLHGAEVGLISGIARPASFRRTVESLGARVVAERSFADHHRFRPAELEGLTREAPLWLTTEKDAGKILPSWVGKADVRVLGIDLRVTDPEPLLDWVEEHLRDKPKGRDSAILA